nr:TNF receptor-associated factor 6-like isoform X3 [Dermacentor andersoni]
MSDPGQGRVYRFRDHVVSGVNWRPTRFVDEVPSSRVCGLCRMIPKQTVLLPCGHALCQSCHAGSLEGGVGHCPLDGEAFEEGECVGYGFPARKVNTVKVYCWNEAHGCEYTGTMDRMLEHYENECAFHTVECLRCGQGVQHRDLLTHYAAGCSAGVSTAITESSQPTAVTLEDVNAALEDAKARLGCLNHDQLLPVIQSQLNELKEEVRNQEATFTRELGACEHNLKAEMEQITVTISSTVSHQRKSQQNPLEEASTSRSLSLRSGQDLILRKLEHLVNLQHSRKTSPKPDSNRVIARCETEYGNVRHLTSALSIPARIKEDGCLSYLLTLENFEEIIQCQEGFKQFAEITVRHMEDTYFTIAVWKYGGSAADLVLKIQFNGTLVDSKCWPPFWFVFAVHKELFFDLLLTPAAERCYCNRDDRSKLHFHLKFRIDIASLNNEACLRDGKVQFRIDLSKRKLNTGIRGAT